MSATSLPKCTNCGQPVAQFEKGGAWHHYHSLFISCDRNKTRRVAKPVKA